MKHNICIFIIVCVFGMRLDGMQQNIKKKPYDKEEQKESVPANVAIVNACLKKMFLTFHDMDEYCVEIIPMKQLEKACKCPYTKKAHFYQRIVKALTSAYISEDTPFLVVTALKGFSNQELRKIFIPLKLYKIFRYWSLVPSKTYTYHDLLAKNFKWDKHQHRWKVVLDKDNNVYMPLDFVTRDQELINREDYSKIYFPQEAWNKNLQELLSSYDNKTHIKGNFSAFCCYNRWSERCVIGCSVPVQITFCARCRLFGIQEHEHIFVEL